MEKKKLKSNEIITDVYIVMDGETYVAENICLETESYGKINNVIEGRTRTTLTFKGNLIDKFVEKYGIDECE